MLASMLASCAPEQGIFNFEAIPAEASTESLAYTDQEAWDGNADTTWAEDYDTAADGTVFEIEDGGDLKQFVTLVAGGKTFAGMTVKLKYDINLGNRAWSFTASTTNYFQGIFDGNNKTIGGFTIACNANNKSLLGTIGGNAIVKNVTIADGDLTINHTGTTAATNAAILVSSVVKGVNIEISGITIADTCSIVRASTAKTYNQVGAIVGRIDMEATSTSAPVTLTIQNCTNNAGIAGSGYTSGIVSRIVMKGGSLTISGCHNKGAIASTSSYAAGIVAKIENSATAGTVTITNCTNTKTVSAVQYLGGISGQIVWLGNVTIGDTTNDVENSGKIELKSNASGGNAGGIVGQIITATNETVSETITLQRCKNSGTVQYVGEKPAGEGEIAAWMGGIAGYIVGGGNINSLVIKDCDNTGDVLKASRCSGGIVGFIQKTSQLSITDCDVNADLEFSFIGDKYAGMGGIVGVLNMASANDANTKIENCTVGGTFTINDYIKSDIPNVVGGIIGIMRASEVQINNCEVSTVFKKGVCEDSAEIYVAVGGVWTSNTAVTRPTAAQCIVNNFTYINRNSLAKIDVLVQDTKAIGYQYKKNEDGTYNLRFIFGIGSESLATENYDKALGFEVALKKLGWSVTDYPTASEIYVDTIYTHINGQDGVEKKTYSAADYGCDYMFALSITGIPASEMTFENGKLVGINALFNINTFTQSTKEDKTDRTYGVKLEEYSLEPERHTFETEDFHVTLPEAFKNSTGIIGAKDIEYTDDTKYTTADNDIDQVDCQEHEVLGTFDQSENPGREQYILRYNCTSQDSKHVCTWRANGAVAYRLNENVPFHYYIDEANFNKVYTNNTLADRYEAYHSWTFEVTEAGYYDFCFQIRLSDSTQTRYALVQFDNEAYGAQTEFYYSVYASNGNNRDNATNANSYITGYGRYLTKGTHTITFRLPYNTFSETKNNSMHIREIYFTKSVESPANADIPLPAGAVLYDGNFGSSVTYCVDNVANASALTDYVTTLKNNGFAQQGDPVTKTYSFSKFDTVNTSTDEQTNTFYTLTNANYVVYAYYTQGSKQMRVVVDNVKEYTKYTTVNGANASYSSEDVVTTPLFAMLDMGGAIVSNGMCLVYRLSDGRFIVVDGGEWNKNDADNAVPAELYNWLCKHADYDEDGDYTNNTVTIAAWILTHHHTDHIDNAWKFEQLYGKTGQVTIENYIYNFPSYDYVKNTYGGDISESTYKTLYPRTHEWMDRYSAQTLTAHTGMTYHFADCSIEVLYTHEDYYPQKLLVMNNSSTAYKITLAGKTFLVSGDLSEAGQLQAIKQSGTLLESDYLQMTHHGLNAQKAFYQYIVGLTDADTDGTTFNEDTIVLLPIPKYPDNTSTKDSYRNYFNGGVSNLASTAKEANGWLLEAGFLKENDLRKDNVYAAYENCVIDLSKEEGAVTISPKEPTT